MQTFVKRREKCQRNKHSSHHTKEPIVIKTIVNAALEKMFLGIFETILSVHTFSTKYVKAYPLITKGSEEIAKKNILRYVIPRDTELSNTIEKEM